MVTVRSGYHENYESYNNCEYWWEGNVTYWFTVCVIGCGPQVSQFSHLIGIIPYNHPSYIHNSHPHLHRNSFTGNTPPDPTVCTLMPQSPYNSSSKYPNFHIPDSRLHISLLPLLVSNHRLTQIDLPAIHNLKTSSCNLYRKRIITCINFLEMTPLPWTDWSSFMLG